MRTAGNDAPKPQVASSTVAKQSPHIANLLLDALALNFWTIAYLDIRKAHTETLTGL